jgi:chromosome segregation ATPase
VTVSKTRANEKPAGYSRSKKSTKARGLAPRERSFANDREAKGEAAGRIEEHDSLLESYLRGLTEHRNNLHEYLRELGQEREELERERGDLDLKLEANEEKRERVTGYIEEIPQLRDKTLRSLVKGMEDQGVG